MVEKILNLPIAYLVIGGLTILIVVIILAIWLNHYYQLGKIKVKAGDFGEIELEKKNGESSFTAINPLVPKTIEKLREALRTGGRVNWIDREAKNNVLLLRKYGRIIITSRMDFRGSRRSNRTNPKGGE